MDRNILTVEDGKESYETLSSGNKTDISPKYYTTSTPLHLRMREHHRREGIKLVWVREPRCLLWNAMSKKYQQCDHLKKICMMVYSWSVNVDGKNFTRPYP